MHPKFHYILVLKVVSYKNFFKNLMIVALAPTVTPFHIIPKADNADPEKCIE